IFVDGQVPGQGHKRGGEVHPGQDPLPLRRHREPQHLHPAGRRQQEPEQHRERRRLPGAVGAQEPDDLARPDMEREVVHVDAGAGAAETVGFVALWANETKRNPFIQLALAARATSRILLGTGVAIAFPRSPTVMAHLAWDLAALSGGRFILGLGTQVKAHIERRFGLSWDPPAPKLREYVDAVRAVWRSWQEGAPLRVDGRYYRLSLMTPFFNPGPIASPDIPVFIAGVNPLLCRLAGRVAQGFHVHPFHTVPYLTSVVLPNIERGLRAERRPRA